jgi:hypothetical protein
VKRVLHLVSMLLPALCILFVLAGVSSSFSHGYASCLLYTTEANQFSKIVVQHFSSGNHTYLIMENGWRCSGTPSNPVPPPKR